jgi:hypothetical protein
MASPSALLPDLGKHPEDFYASRKSARWWWLAQQAIYRYFQHLTEQYFKDHSTEILVWKSRATFENYVVARAPWHLPGGIHLSDVAYDEELQLLLNHLINK